MRSIDKTLSEITNAFNSDVVRNAYFEFEASIEDDLEKINLRNLYDFLCKPPYLDCDEPDRYKPDTPLSDIQKRTNDLQMMYQNYILDGRKELPSRLIAECLKSFSSSDSRKIYNDSLIIYFIESGKKNEFTTTEIPEAYISSLNEEIKNLKDETERLTDNIKKIQRDLTAKQNDLQKVENKLTHSQNSLQKEQNSTVHYQNELRKAQNDLQISQVTYEKNLETTKTNSYNDGYANGKFSGKISGFFIGVLSFMLLYVVSETLYGSINTQFSFISLLILIGESFLVMIGLCLIILFGNLIISWQKNKTPMWGKLLAGFILVSTFTACAFGFIRLQQMEIFPDESLIYAVSQEHAVILEVETFSVPAWLRELVYRLVTLTTLAFGFAVLYFGFGLFVDKDTRNFRGFTKSIVIAVLFIVSLLCFLYLG